MREHEADNHKPHNIQQTYTCMVKHLTHEEKENLRTRIYFTIKQKIDC